MGEYKVGLCVLIQAGLCRSAGSQGLLGSNFLLSLWLYLTELEGGKREDRLNINGKPKKQARKRDKTYHSSPLI